MAWNGQQIDYFIYISALCLDWKDSLAKHVQCTTCMNAQGTFEPPRGQRSPLGQNTSGFVLTCFLIQSAEQGKQNLWWGAVGHCTKCVSSRRCAQMVHFSSGLFGIASASEVIVLLNAVQIISPLVRWEKAGKKKCYIEEAWRCSWSFLLPGVGTLTPFLPISLEEVTWLRVGVPASPGCERELTIDVVSTLETQQAAGNFWLMDASSLPSMENLSSLFILLTGCGRIVLQCREDRERWERQSMHPWWRDQRRVDRVISCANSCSLLWTQITPACLPLLAEVGGETAGACCWCIWSSGKARGAQVAWGDAPARIGSHWSSSVSTLVDFLLKGDQQLSV